MPDEQPKLEYALMSPGDPVPWPVVRASNNPEFKVSSLGGRYTLLGFFMSAADPASQAAIAALETRPDLFNDDKLTFFGISCDPEDESQGRVRQIVPGYRYFFDYDGSMSRSYGVLPSTGERVARRMWILVDPDMRVRAVFPFRHDGENLGELLAYLEGLPPLGLYAGIEIQAPVLYLPRVFEPDFCRHLISIYETNGGTSSGFMREIDGKTVVVNDAAHKVRKDFVIEDGNLVNAVQARVRKRIVPEIQKIHNFAVTHMERYLIGCYTAEDGGHFQAHRDNTTKGTSHRRYAVSINLNNDFEGGELNFPEYGPRTFKPPVGGAVVFSCSLLHMVHRVTRGRRYAFLPFLYDEAASLQRVANNPFLADENLHYKG